MIFLIVLIVLVAVAATPFVIERRRKIMDATARRGAEGAFAQLSQGVTHFDWIGPVRGPVAVCVHGMSTPSFVWRGLARGMAKLGYRVLIYDLYGRGYSDRPGGVQDANFFVRQLDDLIANQDVPDDFTLVGYSMGGAIATAYAARNPTRVRQLILLAPAGFGILSKGMTSFIAKTPVIGDWLFYAFFPRNHRKGTETERHLPSSVEQVVDRQQTELEYQGFVPAVLSSLRGLITVPQEEAHRAIYAAGVPVLAIWGREDDVIPSSSMGTLAEWSRDARQDVIDGAGHGLVYTHTPAVLASMRDALRDGLG